MNCHLEFYNPPDFNWGYVYFGESSGLYKLLEETTVDILACAQYQSIGPFQVCYS